MQPNVATTRGMNDRLRKIQLRLVARKGVGDNITAQSLAAEMGVSARTIKRDLEAMKDDFALPIEYDEAEHSWMFTAGVSDFPMMQVTEGELVSLVLARAALHGAGSREKPRPP